MYSQRTSLKQSTQRSHSHLKYKQRNILYIHIYVRCMEDQIYCSIEYSNKNNSIQSNKSPRDNKDVIYVYVLYI